MYTIVIPTEQKANMLDNALSKEFETLEEAEGVLSDIINGKVMVAECVDEWEHVDVTETWDMEFLTEDAYIKEVNDFPEPENYRIVEWNKERGLIKTPTDLVIENEMSYIIEEVIECMTNLDSTKANPIAKLISLAIKNGNVKTLASLIEEHDLQYSQDGGDEPITPTGDQIVDACSDMKVFATGTTKKAGYDPDIAMDETLKEIESRVGTIIDGKFVKDKSDEAKLKWYKANYDIAKV